MSIQDDNPLAYLQERILRLEKQQKLLAKIVKATVTRTSPLQVKFDEDDQPLDAKPDTDVYGLMPGDRVTCALQNGRLTVLGRAGGRVGDLRGTTADRIALGLSGEVRTRMRFFDEDENVEYVWFSTGWESTKPVYYSAYGFDDNDNNGAAMATSEASAKIVIRRNIPSKPFDQLIEGVFYSGYYANISGVHRVHAGVQWVDEGTTPPRDSRVTVSDLIRDQASPAHVIRPLPFSYVVPAGSSEDMIMFQWASNSSIIMADINGLSFSYTVKPVL